MKIGIQQPYFFPYIGYWQLINAVDRFVVYDDVNYIKGGWINRNKILINGKPSYINVNMMDSSPNKLINEIHINPNRVLLSKNIKTITYNYCKAPYFNEAFPVIEEILRYHDFILSRYLFNLIKSISEYLGITTELLFSSDIVKNNELKGQDKVIDICEKLGATEYYNTMGGQKLYSKKAFRDKGIDLFFIKTREITYSQFKEDYEPFLSIIDVMMFNSKQQIKGYLDMYDKI